MNKRSPHRGVALWRDIHDSTHWVVTLFSRWNFHVYTRAEGREKHLYLTGQSVHGLNGVYEEFRRVLPIHTNTA